MTTNDPGHGSNPAWQQPPWAGQQAYPASPGAGGPKRSWFARHKILTALLAAFGVLFVLSGIGAALVPPEDAAEKPAAASSEDTTKGIALDPSYTTPSPAPAAPEVTEAETTTPAKPKPPAAPALTVGQQQAIGAAESYLEFSAFSRLGLIRQLSSDYGSGFSKADATFAVDHIKVNWKEQAVRSAKEYLSTQNFSRKGLIRQLSSQYGSQFTLAEATYAADKVGL